VACVRRPRDRAVPGPSARRLGVSVANHNEEQPVTEHDVLVGFRLRLFTLA